MSNINTESVCGGVSSIFQQAAAFTAASLFEEALLDAPGIDIDKIKNMRDNSIELIENHGVMNTFDIIKNQTGMQSPIMF